MLLIAPLHEVPVAFHAPFDAGILRRHGLKLRGWVDLATLMPALFPERAPRQCTLDHWLAAFAAAQLLLAALAQLKRQRSSTVEELIKTERGARWLARY
jgi:hypothetical protein